MTLRVLVPGFGTSEWGQPSPDEWLHRHLGRGEWASTPHRSPMGDAIEFHFRCLEDAGAFRRAFPMAVLADGTMSDVYASPDWPFGRGEENTMCNLYSNTTAADAMRQLFKDRPWENRAGNLAPQPSIYPDQLAPVILRAGEGHVLKMARWGLPTPPQFLQGKKTDRGVTNVRNTKSPHWRHWLGPENRCLVPFTRFAEPDRSGPGGNAWFSLPDDQPAFFAGFHVPEWTSVRKLKDGETTDDLFAFLTCPPNAEVGAIHPKAMPVILTEAEEWGAWLSAPWSEAAALQRPLGDGALLVV